MYDPDLLGPDLDFDVADYDLLDARDAAHAEDLRVLTTGLPARPGTRR